MIAFDLQCANGHCFEGWFEDNDTFETQSRQGLISCPMCSNTDVFKIPSTFSIKSSKTGTSLFSDTVDMVRLGQKIAAFVNENFDDVGSEFSKEALKIHYGVSEPRNIRGVSTKAEEKTLEEEGVNFIKIPMPANPETEQ
jgi:hypothetical protein